MAISDQSSASARQNIFDLPTSPAPALVPPGGPEASIFAHPPVSGQPPRGPRTPAKASSWRLASSPLKRWLVVGALGTTAAVAAVIGVEGTGSQERSPERTDRQVGKPSPSRQRAGGIRPKATSARRSTPRVDRPDANAPPTAPRRVRRQDAPPKRRLERAGAVARPPATPSASASTSPNPPPSAPAPPPAAPVVPQVPEPSAPLPVAPGAPPQFM